MKRAGERSGAPPPDPWLLACALAAPLLAPSQTLRIAGFLYILHNDSPFSSPTSNTSHQNTPTLSFLTPTENIWKFNE